MMLDLLKPDEGEVSIDGINPAHDEVWKNTTGAYIDEGFLIDYLTPEEYFDFLRKIGNMTKEEIDAQLEDFTKFAGGEVFGQKKLIRNLSAGNKQKVGIMAAMLHQPKLLILDEPFNFLDPSSQNMLKHLLTRYNEKTGATIIISSHNLQHTVDISTRVALLEKGKIIKDLINEEGSSKSELADYFGAE
jgi:ABC-2 type transport system ATP-binding protein